MERSTPGIDSSLYVGNAAHSDIHDTIRGGNQGEHGRMLQTLKSREQNRTCDGDGDLR